MATFTSRVGLNKPAGTDKKQRTVLNSNFDKIDASLGVQWVADGGSPSSQFDGATYKEIGTGIEYVSRTDGSGGYIKKPREAHNIGTINRYTAAVAAGSIGSSGSFSLPANAWQTISGTTKSWTADRDGIARVRVVLDVVPGHTPSGLMIRFSGLATTESVPLYITSGTRCALECSMLIETVQSVAITWNIDGYSFAGGSLAAQALRHYVDTNAVLT